MKKILLVSMIVFVIWYRNSWALHLTSNGEATWQQTGKKYLWSGVIFSQNYKPNFCVHGRLPHTKGRMTFVNYSRMCFRPSESKKSCGAHLLAVGNVNGLLRNWGKHRRGYSIQSMLYVKWAKKYWRIRPQLDANLQIRSSGAVLVGFLISCKQVRNSCGDAFYPRRGICVLSRVSSPLR